MGTYYLGAYPPGYGGVTIKNQNLYTALHAHIDIKKIDFNEIKRKNVKTLLLFVQVFFDRKNTFVIGVSGKKTRRRFCKLLYLCNKPALKRSIIFLMGGAVSKDIAGDKEYQKYVAEYKQVYVETRSMKRELEEVGLKNIGIYPNCRFHPKFLSPTDKSTGQQLKCVFFSLIQPEKGVDLLIDAAKKTPEITYAFYGPIDDAYRDIFFEAISGAKNIVYYGIFKGSMDAVCRELSKYDVLLFPTKWNIEGVPGVLVEAKIAGITCIVSDKSYNADIVKDGVSGIVLKENTTNVLVEAIKSLDEDRELLYALKCGAQKSAEYYYVENYINDILDKLIQGGGMRIEH